MKTFKLTQLASVLLALCAGSAGAVPLNLVQNGGFEDTAITRSQALAPSSAYQESVANGWYNYLPSGSNFNVLYLPGESTTIGATGINNNPASGPAILWAATESPSGGNFIASDGDSTVYSEISQIIYNLTVGQMYDLKFDFAGAQFKVPFNGITTAAWDVRFGSEMHTTPIIQTVTGEFNGWSSSTMRFTATAANQALVFMSRGTPNGLPPVTLLDGVSLTEVVEVPEPASLALTLAGLFGIGVSRRGKRNSTQTNLAA